MMVEVQGINFRNKGAELMLRSIVEEVKRWDEEVSLAVSAHIGSYQDRSLLGLYQKLWLPYVSGLAPLIARCVPQRFRHLYGVVADCDISAVLDASGFVYGDQWGPRGSEFMAKLNTKWKKQGKAVVLLPQAFGPFQNPRVRRAMLRVLDRVDLVFARDQQSCQYLLDLGRGQERIRLAPDFTITAKGQLPPGFVAAPRSVAVVPNQRMLDKTTSEVMNRYVSSLQETIAWLQQRNFAPFLLVHDIGDRTLAQRLQAEGSKPIPLVFQSDPLLLKGIIGRCHLVIGSRYHALVSSLSQSVPTLGIGWSHKYPALFQDFDCSDYLVDLNGTSSDMLENRLMALTDEHIRAGIVIAISAANRVLADRVSGMWAEVRNLILCR